MDDVFMNRIMQIDRRLDFIEKQLHEMSGVLDSVKETMVKADTTIATVAAEVKPTLDALTGNPMVKMFLKQGDKK